MKQMKFTALHHACDKGQISAVEVLLRAGADPNVKDEHGATAVHWAASSGKVALFSIIVGHHAQESFLHVEDANGASPIHWAAAKGHVDVVKVLLRKGAPLEHQDKHMMTPLHRAAMMGHDAMAKLLLQEGSDAARQDRDGNTALHLACEAGQVGVVRAILSSGRGAGAAYGTMNKAGLTPLAVVEAGHKGALPLLMEFKQNFKVAPEAPEPNLMAHMLQRSANYGGGGVARLNVLGSKKGGFGVTVDGSYVDGGS